MEIVCRICRNIRRKKIIPLLKIVPNSNELEIEGEKFEYCLGLKVLEIPNYPGICTICEQHLNDFYAFKQQAIKSHYELLEITSSKNVSSNVELEIKSEIFDNIDDLEYIEYDKDFLILETMDKIVDSDDHFLNSLDIEEKEVDYEFEKLVKVKVEETDHVSLEMSVDDEGDNLINNDVNQNTENLRSKSCVNDVNKPEEIRKNIKSEIIDRISSPEMFNDDIDMSRDSCDDDGFNTKLSKPPTESGEIFKIKSEIEFSGKLSEMHNDDDLKEKSSLKLKKNSKKKKKKTKKNYKDIDSRESASSGKRKKKKPKKPIKNLPENHKNVNTEESKTNKKPTENVAKSTNEFWISELIVKRRKLSSTKTLKTSEERKKVYKCEICKSRFNIKQKFDGHMNEHKGLPPYQCEICGKTYKIDRRCDFNDHVRDHQGIARRHICELCSKGFHTERDLVVHMRSHNDERPFVCDVCGRGFRTLGPLNYHKDSHNEEKKYKCEICDQLFLLRAALKRHLREDHGNNTFQCEKCNRTFTKRTYFRMHINKYHNELMDKLFPRRRQFYRFQTATPPQI